LINNVSGGASKDVHDFAMQRMVQAGVVPVTWQQVLRVWQRDWTPCWPRSRHRYAEPWPSRPVIAIAMPATRTIGRRHDLG
jgi:hypothetical protein